MSNMKRSRQGKKKTIRNILICAAVAVVIALIIFFVIAFQKDAAGMNCFQRHATVASAYGEKVSMAEYRVLYDSYGAYTQFLTPENIAQQLLLEKIYTKEAKKLGLNLTKEEEDACKAAAQGQIDGYRKLFTDRLMQSGSYSKTALEKQMANFYDQIGMNENEYYSFLKSSVASEYYHTKLTAYYEEHGSGIDEEALLKYYRENVEASMKTTDENGQEKSTYSDGQYWTALNTYTQKPDSGVLPMLYVPEGFFYIDYIKVEGASTEEVEEIVRQVTDDKTFDELMNSDRNKSAFRGTIEGPYPIAEHDHNPLFASQEAYDTAAALQVGQIGSHIENPSTAEDGTVTVTGYLFRRANGNMCIDGEHGVIKIDFYPDIRKNYEDKYRYDQWFADVKYEDALYTYKGVSE